MVFAVSVLSVTPVSLQLKEYSVILTTSFYGMNQKIETKEILFPKF